MTTTQPKHSPLIAGAPPIVAHRGFAARYPENTLEAMQAAVAVGARYLECDIQLSADHVPFLMHDPDFKRTAGLDQRFFELDAAEIDSIKVGESARFGEQFIQVRPTRLTTFCQYLNQLSGQGIHTRAFIEVKEESTQHFDLETVMQAIVGCTGSLHSAYTLIAFDTDVVRYAEAQKLSSGLVLPEWSEQIFQFIEQTRPDFVFSDTDIVPSSQETLPEIAHWALYEVTEPNIAQHWLERGSALIETMEVEKLLESNYSNRTSEI